MDQPGKRRPRSLLLAAQHQLRQPLNALGLLVGDLRQGASGCDLGGRELEGIVADMRYALHLSNTWLDALSDLEAADQGLLEPTLQAVPLQPLFARLQESFAPRFSALGLDFRVVSTGAVVRADPDLLCRLLTLLLDNAAKFTPAGKVLLGCRRSGGGVRIEVRDSGPGIAEKQAAQVFEPFFRLENEVRPRERGLGLGLAYARRLAELAGDSLTLTGRPGRGCCFAVALQPAGYLTDGVAADPAAEPVNPLAGAEVLLLEGPGAGTLRGQLAAWGAAVRLLSPDELPAALAAGAPLLIADRAVFADAGGWQLERVEGATIVLVSDRQPDRPDLAGSGVHSLLRPLRPARLRALCHYALMRR